MALFSEIPLEILLPAITFRFFWPDGGAAEARFLSCWRLFSHATAAPSLCSQVYRHLLTSTILTVVDGGGFFTASMSDCSS